MTDTKIQSEVDLSRININTETTEKEMLPKTVKCENREKTGNHIKSIKPQINKLLDSIDQIFTNFHQKSVDYELEDISFCVREAFKTYVNKMYLELNFSSKNEEQTKEILMSNVDIAYQALLMKREISNNNILASKLYDIIYDIYGEVKSEVQQLPTAEIQYGTEKHLSDQVSVQIEIIE